MRLPRKYKKECKKRFLSSSVPDRSRKAFRDLYRSWILDLPCVLDRMTYDLYLYVRWRCDSRHSCRANLVFRPFNALEFNLEELKVAARIENILNKPLFHE